MPPDPHDTLEAWRRSLATPDRAVPDFDPADGGAAARLLVLLETPGAGMAPPCRVSRDNPTGTARNLARFLAAVPQRIRATLAEAARLLAPDTLA